LTPKIWALTIRRVIVKSLLGAAGLEQDAEG